MFVEFKQDMLEKILVGCILVTYNPEFPLLKKVFMSVKDQVDSILIVDNNSNNFKNIQSLVKGFKKVRIIHNTENLGVASAYNIGKKVLLSSKIDYILLLDQDTILHRTYVYDIFTAYNNLSDKHRQLNVGLLTALAYKRREGSVGLKLARKVWNGLSKNTLRFNEDFEEIKSVINSGSLIKRAVFQNLDYNDAFF